MLRILFTGHKYAGLMLGLLLSLTGLSGSILVFDHALDELLTPELYGIGDPQTASLQKALEAAQLEHDVVRCQEILQDAYRTDVRPLLQQARLLSGAAIDPINAYRKLDVRRHLTDQRGKETVATGL